MNKGADKEGLPTSNSVLNIIAPLPRVRSDPRRSPPLFLHSSFRTGSTWLWQKLREAPTTLAYYEIFNEILETITEEQASRLDFSSWPSKHPVSSPYFLEFAPFIGPGGGVPGFDGSMGIEGTIPPSGPEGDLHHSQDAHVQRLIAAAWSQRRIPILSCTRSLGRARALRRAFGGQTIVLHKNLFHQWSSYCILAENGDPSFIYNMCQAILAAEQDPYLRKLASWFGLREKSRSERETLFPVFVLFHLYLYSIAFDAADLIVDVTEITTDATVRRHVERELSEMVCHAIDLSDVRPSCEFTSLDVNRPQNVRDTIEQFVKLIPAASMSIEAADFIDQAKERALAEWDRWEVFTRRTRRILTQKLDDAAAGVEAQSARNASLQAEIDRLGVELSERARLQAVQQAEHDAAIRRLTDERDALSQTLSASETARVGLDAIIADVSAARDAAVADAATAAARQDALELELKTVQAESEVPVHRRVWKRLAQRLPRQSA